MMQTQYVITATRKKDGVNAAEDAAGLTPGAAGAPSLTPSRVDRTELDVWILAVSLDEHETSGGSGRASDGGQRSCSFSLSIGTCA